MRETKNEILDAALELYLQGGDKAVTMRAIGEHIGLSAMSIYRHFANRADVLRHTEKRGMQVFLDYLNIALEQDSARSRLQATGEQYLNFALEQPQIYAMIFMQPRAESSSNQWRESHTFQFLVARVQDCIDHGIIQSENAGQTALLLWAHIHGLVSLHQASIMDLDDAGFRQVYQSSAQQLLERLQ